MEEIVKQWKKNKYQVELASAHLNRFHIRAARKQTKLNELTLDNIFAKLILPLWVSLIEIDFNILIYENYNITQKFMEDVELRKLSECEKWIALINFCFKKHYLHNFEREITKFTLGDTNYHRYVNLIEIVEKDLKPCIELRNRISHGQWAIAFNQTGTDKNNELTQHAWTLSKKDLMLLKILALNFPKLIKLLIISKNTFERDYDTYVYKIDLAKRDVDMRLKHLLGKAITNRH